MRLAHITEPFQWQVVRADFDPVEGSEQAGVRPAIIVSKESINKVLPIVSVIPLTTRKPNRRSFPNDAFIGAGQAGLPHESVALAYQIRTISKTRLLGSYGTLTDEATRENVRQALRIHLDLN